MQDKCKTILADPAWAYNQKTIRGGAANHYKCMSVDDNYFQIRKWTEGKVTDDAHLYMWTTNAFMLDALKMMERLGFNQKTIITWAKEPGIGCGFYFRNTTEHCLFGVKGKLKTNTNNTKTHFIARRTKHSKKPEEFYDIIEANSPGPYMELFARNRREGWTSHGNEV